jgi:hypothetical protein
VIHGSGFRRWRDAGARGEESRGEHGSEGFHHLAGGI